MSEKIVGAHILLADDDPLIRDLVSTTLGLAGMTPVLAHTGTQALEVWRSNSVDLVILDIMMPDMTGLEVCRFIRQVSDIPILMLTALGDEKDILLGFEAGADDYLIKPFRPPELIARIQAILQRMTRLADGAGKQLTYGDLTLDTLAQRALRRGAPVPVTALEFRLMQYLMQRVGQMVSKQDLFQNVWGYVMPVGGMNLIEVAVRRLREKVEDDPSHPAYIQTVRGAGYRFGH